MHNLYVYIIRSVQTLIYSFPCITLDHLLVVKSIFILKLNEVAYVTYRSMDCPETYLMEKVKYSNANIYCPKFGIPNGKIGLKLFICRGFERIICCSRNNSSVGGQK